MKNNKKEAWPPRVDIKEGDVSGWADLAPFKEQREQRVYKKGEAGKFEANAETETDFFPPSEETEEEIGKREKPGIFRLKDLKRKKE